MKYVKDYKINLGVFVLYELLEPLRSAFFGHLPEEVDKELEKFNDVLLKYLNVHDPKYKNVDLDNVEYFMRYYYIPESKKRNNNDL